MKIELDSETADRITLLVLKDYHNYLKKELRKFKKGGYLHPDDVAENLRTIESLNHLIKHFGG